jgi:hypothetical protein
MWIEHDNAYYNLDKFTQIVRGDDDEILLVNLNHNMTWDDEEENMCSLKFPSVQDRELAFTTLQVKLSVKYLGELK